MSKHLTPPAKRSSPDNWSLLTYGAVVGILLAGIALIVWPDAGEPTHQMRRVHVTTTAR